MAKTLGGFGGATLRRRKASTVTPAGRYADAIYVLHALQKKSKKRIATPKTEMDLVEKRLKDLIREKEAQL